MGYEGDTERTTRIAVVDDEPTIARVVRELLEPEGYDVRTFGEPRAAFGALLEAPAHVLVVDYNMPRCTGAELVRELRAHHDGPSAPAILITGARNDVPMVDRAPFEAILEKPFKPAHLTKVVEFCVQMATGRGASRSGTRRRQSVPIVAAPGESASGSGSTD